MRKTSLLNLVKHRSKFIGVVLACVLLVAATYYFQGEQVVYNQQPNALTTLPALTGTFSLNVAMMKTINPDMQYLLSIDPTLFSARYHYEEISSVDLQGYVAGTSMVLNTRGVTVNVTLYDGAVWFVYVSGNSTLFIVLHISGALYRFYLGGNYNRYHFVLNYYPQTAASPRSHLYLFLVH